MIVFADTHFHKARGDCSNLKPCERGTWNVRMVVESVFSLFDKYLWLEKTRSSLMESRCHALGIRHRSLQYLCLVVWA